MPKREIAHGVGLLIGAVVALWILLCTVASQFWVLVEVFEPGIAELEERMDLKTLFRDFVFPVIFLNACWKYGKKIGYMWEESEVQMV